jgi:beta-lactamase regulating signal transducer with metallopeptidase domain
MDPQPTTAERTVSTNLDSTPAPRPWQTRIGPIFPAIVGLWMTGVGALSLRLLGGWVLARRLVRRDTRPLVGAWIDRLKERMRMRHAVAFLESAHVEVPMVIGWLRPAILVPVAALSGLTAPELEAILAHELAHIRRHDYVVNLLQCVVEVLIFYHPATWWITRVIRREREHCCDDMAVAASCDRLTYARALAALEGLRAPAFSLSPAANGGNLLARIRRILEPQEESMKPVRILVGLAVILAVAPIWLTRADDQPTKADPRTGRPQLNRIESAAGVRAEFKAWKKFLPIAEIDAAPTGRFLIDPLAFPIRCFADILVEKLIVHYQKQGFFEVKVSAETHPNNDGKVELTFVVSEGPRYQVRNVIIEGNTKIKTEVLREGMELHSGKPFLVSVRDADKNRLLAKYYELGYIEAEVAIEPKFTEKPGVVDLVYKIVEKDPYLLGELEIRGNARTKDKVLRREAVQAGLLPGEVLDKNRIDIYRRRLESLQICFGNDPGQGKQIKVEIVRKRPKGKPYGDLMMPLLGEVQQARMLDPGPGPDLSPAPAAPAQAPGTCLGPNPFSPNNALSPPAGTMPVVDVPPADASQFLPPGTPECGPAVGNAPAAPVGASEPPASFSSLPGMNTNDVGPDRNDPFPNQSFADIVTLIEEAPTGRFMIGVGANSIQGLMGTISIYEKNLELIKDLEDQIDRVSHEIEQLKRKLELDLHEQERVADRPIKEQAGLKKHHDLDKINDAEAEKTFVAGMYYKRIGKFTSAQFAFSKLIQRWPDSPWATKAKEQQVQADPKPSDHTKVEYFNFLVGGIY